MAKNETFFQRLTRLFRSGPAIQRRIKGYDYNSYYDTKLIQGNYGYRAPAPFGFGRENSPFSVLGSYGILDRMSRYAEFAEMEYTPEIAAALDIYADEVVGGDDRGKSFHIYSDDINVKRALEELFYDTLNVEFNLRPWTRNLVKYGDLFLYNEVLPEIGVINAQPIPVSEVEREEGFDEDDPYAVRFKWLTRGNVHLENWQVTHMRILGNDLFLPYGTAVLEPARRIWRQLCHLSGTRVLTGAGYKNIEDVKSGDIVYTHIPEQKKTIKTKVKHVINMGTQPIVSVETNHRTIKVTPNHGLLVLDKNGNFVYKKAEELIQSQGRGGKFSKNADKLVLPAILAGNSSIKVNFEELAKNYCVKLVRSANEIERKNIVNRLKAIKTSTGYKNIHQFLNGKKRISWSDYQLVKAELGLTTPVEYYYAHSKKKSVFFNRNNHVCELDKEFIKFFGFMLGDGWVKKSIIGFALGVYQEQNEAYIKYASKLLGNDLVLSIKPNSLSAQVNWSNIEVANMFRHLQFKTGFANKEIPDWIYQLDIDSRKAFIQGMFDADGCEKTNTICFSNKKLIEQTQELCWTIGIPVGKKIGIRPERNGHKESYKLWLDLKSDSEEVVYENVLRVIKQDEGETWDLEVEHEEHNFLANGLVTHNTMMEDAMLVYRVVRSPERRVFYIDVGNVAPNDVPSYMEAAKATLRSHSIVEKNSGRMDMRHNPLAVDEDYYIPVRGAQSGTKIETLAGGQHVTATEDVQYIQSKLFAALKVPKPYLNYDENLSSKATLAQEDIRFSRTIGGIQKIIISEMNKLAMIHLFAKGFDGEDLINFELKLSNPSSVAIQQKLELWASKADVAGTLKDTKLVDERWIQKNVLELTDDDIQSITKGLYEDKIKEVQLDAVAFEAEPERNTTTDTFNPANYNMGGEEVKKAPPVEGQAAIEKPEIQIPSSGRNSPFAVNYTQEQTPIKATPFLTRNRKNRSRRVGAGGRSNTASPDFSAMLNPGKNKSLRDVFDSDFLSSPTRREHIDRHGNVIEEDIIPIKVEPVFPNEIRSILKRLKDHFNKVSLKRNMLTEQIDLKELEKDPDDMIINLFVESEEKFDSNKPTSLKEMIQDIDEEIVIDEDGDVEIELE